MTAAGRAHRHHRQSQYALAVALAALGCACLVAATQLASPAGAHPVGAHLPLRSQAGAASASSEVTRDPATAPSADMAREADVHEVGAEASLEPRPAPVSNPLPSIPSPSPAGRSAVSLPARIEIPAIGVHSNLGTLGLDDDLRLEVPDDPDVAGWYAGGPRPGEEGAAVVVGHVDWTDGPAVFWQLAELSPGDHVVVHGIDGTVTDFVVDRLERWPKDEFPTELVYDDADPELRLITCGGPFDEGANAYRDNVIAFATLAS